MTNLATYHTANLPELMKVIRQNGIGMDDYLTGFSTHRHKRQIIHHII